MGRRPKTITRQEIAGVEAGTGLQRYGDLSVGSILGVVDAVARATRFAGSVPCALRGNRVAGVLRDEVMCFCVVIAEAVCVASKVGRLSAECRDGG
jgi:hypothetical protein